MEPELIGSYLRRQREKSGLTLADVSRAIKIKEQSLVALEASNFEALPARVFVVGWVGAYAKAVGADPSEAMSKLSLASLARGPSPLGECMPKVVARAPEEDARSYHDRRKVSVALVVFLLLIVATVTLSLLLGHGSHGNGLS